MLQFLIDECLSPSLAAHAKARGYAALHVNWIERSGYPDRALTAYAIGGDYVFVTNNGADFRPIYRALDIHPGLVVILPSLKGPGQIKALDAVIEALEASPDTVNKLIEVDAQANVTISDFPPFRENI